MESMSVEIKLFPYWSDTNRRLGEDSHYDNDNENLSNT